MVRYGSLVFVNTSWRRQCPIWHWTLKMTTASHSEMTIPSSVCLSFPHLSLRESQLHHSSPDNVHTPKQWLPNYVNFLYMVCFCFISLHGVIIWLHLPESVIENCLCVCLCFTRFAFVISKNSQAKTEGISTNCNQLFLDRTIYTAGMCERQGFLNSCTHIALICHRHFSIFSFFWNCLWSLISNVRIHSNK